MDFIGIQVLKGPIGATFQPVDADKFLDAAVKFEDATLSVGWTTKWDSKPKPGKYTDEDVEKMLKTLEQHKLNETAQPITFPVRAGIAAMSLDTLPKLIEKFKRATLTIWSSEKDSVNVTDLQTLIWKIGVDKVYVDVPKELSDRMDLSADPTGGSTSTAISTAHFGLLNMAVVLLQKLF